VYAFQTNRPACECILHSLYITDSAIEYVKEWQHLGDIIEVDQSDSASIINRRNRAIGQIYDELCDFSQ